jgi:heat-inducible transcriptional repressor
MLNKILPEEPDSQEMRIIIGTENKAEVAQDCSLVISRYGLPHEASGTILVVGPTRMAYPRVISTVSFLAALLSGLVGELYGVNTFDQYHRDNAN